MHILLFLFTTQQSYTTFPINNLVVLARKKKLVSVRQSEYLIFDQAASCSVKILAQIQNGPRILQTCLLAGSIFLKEPKKKKKKESKECYVTIALSKNRKVVPSLKIDKSVWTNLEKDELSDSDSPQAKMTPPSCSTNLLPSYFSNAE